MILLWPVPPAFVKTLSVRWPLAFGGVLAYLLYYLLVCLFRLDQARIVSNKNAANLVWVSVVRSWRESDLQASWILPIFPPLND